MTWKYLLDSRACLYTMPEEDMLLKQSKALSAFWSRLFAGQVSVDEFEVLAAESQGFMRLVEHKA